MIPILDTHLKMHSTFNNEAVILQTHLRYCLSYLNTVFIVFTLRKIPSSSYNNSYILKAQVI